MNLWDPNLPLNKVVFAIFDVETTGLSPAYHHRVCEIACLRLQNSRALHCFESLVDPRRPISPGAFAVNRITSEMLAGSPPFESIAPSLLVLMEDAVLVAHNAPFDLGFLAAELETVGLPPPEGPVIDTLTLSRRIYGFWRTSLAAVATALEAETGPIHRAMGDVWTTRHVLERMLWDLEMRWQVSTLGELLEFQGGSIAYPVQKALPLPPLIAEALEGEDRVLMRYVDSQDRETTRIIRPLRVYRARGALYLRAHCYHRDALRTFRLDRIIELVRQQ